MEGPTIGSSITGARMDHADKWLETLDRVLKVATIAITVRELLLGL